jgi:hypothetical protein
VNSDIASAAAYRPEDGQRMAANQILNDFDVDLRAARSDFPVVEVPAKGTGLRSTVSRARSRAHAVACARVVARLHQAGVR